MRAFRFKSLAAAAALATAVVGVQPAGAQFSAVRGPTPDQRAQLVESLGGAYQGPAAGYVARVGERVAAASGRRDCRFTVVNSPVVNAFAVPPVCDVYVTRGLLSVMNSEDELAAVLGHEVSHITANHAGRRQNRSAWTGLGAMILGAITGSGEVAQLASQFGQMNVLSYSRNQEHEADNLGLRAVTQAGYSPYALADMLRSLEAQDRLDARSRGRDDARTVPAWGRTHPLTGERIARAAQQARQTGLDPEAVAERELAYLQVIDGMIWGDDPQQGFVEGRAFLHPRMRVAFTAPQGFTLTNSPRAVKIEGPNVRGEFSGGRMGAGGLEAHALGVLRQAAGRTPVQVGRAQPTRINGLDAVVLPARAQTQQGLVEVTVVAYAAGPSEAYHFITLAPSGRSGVLDPLFGSFRRLSEREAAALRPRQVQVLKTRPGDTVQALAARMAVEDLHLERFLAINDLQPGEPLRPGQPVKIVVSGRG